MGYDGIHILIVSDDPSVCDEMQYGVPRGVEVQSAHDSRAAWKLMLDRVPSAVVVDLQTGSAGGFGLRKDMLSDRRLEHVPLLMLLERSQDDWLARQAGATAIMVKPVRASDLVRGTISLLPQSAGE